MDTSIVDGAEEIEEADRSLHPMTKVSMGIVNAFLLTYPLAGHFTMWMAGREATRDMANEPHWRAQLPASLGDSVGYWRQWTLDLAMPGLLYYVAFFTVTLYVAIGYRLKGTRIVIVCSSILMVLSLRLQMWDPKRIAEWIFD